MWPLSWNFSSIAKNGCDIHRFSNRKSQAIAILKSVNVRAILSYTEKIQMWLGSP